MLEQLEKKAILNNIPIMDKEGISYLKELIKKRNIKKILELGTAVGYSAINMALVDPDIKIVTIERDEERYKEAISNIKQFNLEKQIEVILADAIDVSLENKFDLIFIDAAKAQYIKFFQKYEHNLNKNGIIVSDNLNFHGLVNENKDNLSRNLRGLVSKIEKYIEFLKENVEYETEFINVGDGIAVTERRD